MADDKAATILVVDDDEEIAELLETSVTAMGNYRIVKAHSGPEAMKIVDIESPDLILLDIMMEGMDGTEVCRALKSNEKSSHIPVIAVTIIHKIDVRQYRRIMASGVDEYVEKPFEFDEMEEIIKKHLKRSE